MLESFELKREYDPEAMQSVSGLLLQAEAAKNLNERELTFKFYREALRLFHKTRKNGKGSKSLESFFPMTPFAKRLMRRTGGASQS